MEPYYIRGYPLGFGFWDIPYIHTWPGQKVYRSTSKYSKARKARAKARRKKN